MSLATRIEQMSTEEIRQHMHECKFTAVELVVARTLLKKREQQGESQPEEITLTMLDDQITLVIEKGTEKQKREICRLVGDIIEYETLPFKTKRSIMAIKVEEVVVENPPIAKKPVAKECKVKEKKVSPISQPEGNSKSTQIREMSDQGKSVKEIAEALGTHYSFVHGVVKRHKTK